MDFHSRAFALCAWPGRDTKAKKNVKDVPLHGSPLQRDYSVPTLFKGAALQRPRWQWLYWGPPGTSSTLHVDVAGSAAWNVIIKGYKLWWFYFEGGCYNAITGPGDIIVTPPEVAHEVVNLTPCLAITHNYIREWTEEDRERDLGRANDEAWSTADPWGHPEAEVNVGER